MMPLNPNLRFLTNAFYQTYYLWTDCYFDLSIPLLIVHPSRACYALLGVARVGVWKELHTQQT